MRKVYSNKFFIYFSVLNIVVLFIISLACLFFLINSILSDSSNMTIVYSVLLLLFICFMPVPILVLNRFGCQIIYDEEKNIIIRKGFICGYKYELRKEDIKDVIIASFQCETTYYVLVDSINTKYDGGYKKSFIRIEKNEKNYDFIRQFWDKPIKNN